MGWVDNLGNEFDTYEEYCQSKYISIDEKCILLWRGDRIPQDNDERQLKEEIDEITKRGDSFEVYTD
jgi:hypothetical protein